MRLISSFFDHVQQTNYKKCNYFCANKNLFTCVKFNSRLANFETWDAFSHKRDEKRVKSGTILWLFLVNRFTMLFLPGFLGEKIYKNFRLEYLNSSRCVMIGKITFKNSSENPFKFIGFSRHFFIAENLHQICFQKPIANIDSWKNLSFLSQRENQQIFWWNCAWENLTLRLHLIKTLINFSHLFMWKMATSKTCNPAAKNSYLSNWFNWNYGNSSSQCWCFPYLSSRCRTSLISLSYRDAHWHMRTGIFVKKWHYPVKFQAQWLFDYEIIE